MGNYPGNCSLSCPQNRHGNNCVDSLAESLTGGFAGYFLANLADVLQAILLAVL
jgi:hypothetical protein